MSGHIRAPAPTFHGMENENLYTHIRDFEEVCMTFKEGAIDMELLKLKAFPLTRPRFGLILYGQGLSEIGQRCRLNF